MQNSDWVQVGENIKQCVQSAVDSKNFEGLSKTIESSVNGAIDQINKSLAYKQMKSSNYGEPKQTENQNKTARTQNVPVPGKQYQLPRLYPKNPPGTFMAPACKVLGIVGTGIFGLGATVLTVVAAATGTWGVWLADAIVGTFLGGSIALTGYGVKREGMLARFKKYVARIGNEQYCEIQQLANIVGKKKSFVEKDIRKMIDKGYFLQGHIDDHGTTLITSDFMYQKYLEAEQSRKVRELETTQRETLQIEQRTEEYPEQVQVILDEGNRFLRYVEESNDAIPGEAMSQKLYILKDIMARIFEQLRKQPESAEDLQKMMKYYLPTTRKLLEAYRDLDGQPSYGDNNIAKTKKEIEDTLDVINAAFGKLFDDMFAEAAWDISTEISTMKTMLAKEGLTGGRDFPIQ